MIHELNGEMVKWWNIEMVNQFILWNGEMVKWWTCRNWDMVKFQNVMVFFSYLQLVLSYPLINKISESEEGCPHQFLLCIIPLKLHPLLCLLLYPYSCPRCLPLNLPLLHYLHHPPHCVPLILPILYLHVFPHIRPLKIHPSLCLILSPSLCSHCLPLLIPFSHNLE